MNKLFAAIISNSDTAQLLEIAMDFSAKIELIEGGLIFDISGLENLMGTPEKIALRIQKRMEDASLKGNLGIAKDLQTAILFARNLLGVTIDSGNELDSLSLESLAIEDDIRIVLESLGITRISQLKQIPEEQLIARYGQDFRDILDLINQKGSQRLTPNIKEQHIEWSFELDQAVEEFERLVFILANGLGEVLRQTERERLSTEHLTLIFGFENKTEKRYEIRASFPTLNTNFWRKIIDHYVSQSLPEHEIHSIRLICHYTKPRISQLGLYTAARPQPESLQLTMNKLKKLVGEENVGVPQLIDAHLEKPFLLNKTLSPEGIEKNMFGNVAPKIAFSHYDPPLPALVWIKERKLVYLKTKDFSGKVLSHGGVWRGASYWWSRLWSADEWDVEIENRGAFRLLRKNGAWYIIGEYD